MSVVYILIAIMVAALLYISTYFQLLRLRKMSKLKAYQAFSDCECGRLYRRRLRAIAAF